MIPGWDDPWAVHGRPWIVPELGTGSRQSDQNFVQAADDLDRVLGNYPAGVVKLQHLYAQEILHPNAGLVDLPGGPIPLYDFFGQQEISPATLGAFVAQCHGAGLPVLASVFGQRSLAEAAEAEVDGLKVASPELNHLPLLAHMARTEFPLLVSTGVATIADVAEGLVGLAPHRPPLLHCVTAYPTPVEDFNLGAMDTMARAFGVPVGVSDHSISPFTIPVLATLLGAWGIEKHITLDKAQGNPDDPVALSATQFREMVDAVARAAQLRLESPDLQANPSPQTIFEAYHTLGLPHGPESLEQLIAILGHGRKELAPAEAQNYPTTRRSLLAAYPLARGHQLQPEDLLVLRSEKNLKPGLHPRYLPTIMGATLTQDLDSGQGIDWVHLLKQD